MCICLFVCLCVFKKNYLAFPVQYDSCLSDCSGITGCFRDICFDRKCVSVCTLISFTQLIIVSLSFYQLAKEGM